jgi:hypothetical protein
MKKKLIEVALPLEAINKESAREKSIRHGHPSTLHLWWARRPLAACRAVLFASLVDDPSSLPEQFPTEADQDKERQRLFRLIERLVLWENSNNRAVLDEAHAEILKSTGGHPPPIYDPFCGGGSIPLEAQRLGLEAHGSDLNPVAVLITKALIEIPPKFAGQPPVNPAAKKKMSGKGMWTGARGLADDVRYYGQWMRDRAFERIGHLYPKVKLPNGDEATVIAWLWARTVLCPNPACRARMPLVRSFALSTKPGKKAWVEPVIDHEAKRVRFEVREGEGAPEGTVNRKGARCLACGTAVPFEHVRSEGRAGRMRAQLMAIVADTDRGRVYLESSTEHEQIARTAQPLNVPETDLPEKALGFRVQVYGMTRHRDLFTPRQLAALMTFSDLVIEARQQAVTDGASVAHADAIATYLAFAVDKAAEGGTVLCTWSPLPTKLHVVSTFGRQALPMVWLEIGWAVISSWSSPWERLTRYEVQQYGRNNFYRLDAGDVPATWLHELRNLMCIPDNRGTARLPAHLFRRTPDTLALLDVEPFVQDRWDLPGRERVLDELGVRTQPTDASKLLDRLRALSQAGNPPIGPLRDLYRAIERVLPRLPGDRAAEVRDAFAAESLIRTEIGWERSGFCFRENPGSIPGVSVVHSDVRDVIGLWDTLKIQPQPSASDALRWFESLPFDAALGDGDRSAARKVLGLYPQDVWNGQARWLNLQGRIVRTADLRWGCLDPRAVPGLFAAVRSESADCSMLEGSRVQTLMAGPPRLLETLIERRVLGYVPGPGDAATEELWLHSLGQVLSLLNDRDADESALESDRRAAQRMVRTRWIPAQSVHIQP